jgi:hypothetical protein
VLGVLLYNNYYFIESWLQYLGFVQKSFEILQNIDQWDESTERTQNIEFDDNIWIFIFLLISEKQDCVDLNTILCKFQMTFVQILDTVIMILWNKRSYLSTG